MVYVGLSALIGVRIAAGSYRQLADTPAALVEPVPFLGFLDTMPSAEVFVAIQVVGTLAAAAAVAAALLRRRPQLAFAVAWVCYLVLAGLRGSRGKVLHNDLLLLWVSAPFLLAPPVRDVRDRIPRRRWGWPIRVAIVITALIYFFAGYHKLRRSGPEWAYGDNMRYVTLWGPSIGSPRLAGAGPVGGRQRVGGAGVGGVHPRPRADVPGRDLRALDAGAVRRGRAVPARHDLAAARASTTGRGRSPCRSCWSTGRTWWPGRGAGSVGTGRRRGRRAPAPDAADGAVPSAAG